MPTFHTVTPSPRRKREFSGRLRGVAGACVGAALLVALSGCSFLAAAQPSGNLTLPEKNIETWVLPLDQFKMSDSVLSKGLYAEDLLVQPCMEKAGFNWSVPGLDPSADPGPSWNAVGRRVFTAEVVKKWGYHLAPETNSAAKAQAKFAAEANRIDAQEQAAFDGCLFEARKTLPSVTPLLNEVSGFATVAYQDAANDADVRAASKKWKACMLPFGISDLSDSPRAFPSPALLNEFGSASGLDQPDSTPNAREREVAVADLNCQITSGYRQASYDAEWDHQLPLLTENADQLTRIASEVTKHEQAVLAVIASHAPKG